MDEDNILNDKRPIKMIEHLDSGLSYATASGFVIEAYPEPGEYCNRPWFRVKRGGIVIVRVPAQHVSIIYAETPQ